MNHININAPLQVPDFQSQPELPANLKSKLKINAGIFGAGGGGGLMITDIAESRKIGDVSFAAINTEHESLDAVTSLAEKFYIGDGTGSGTNVLKAENAALEVKEEIKKFLSGRDIVFIAGALGKGTGSGVAPVLCQIAKELKILTVAVVAKGFMREGNRMEEIANNAIKKIEDNTNAMFVVENDLVKKCFPGVGSEAQMAKANDCLADAIRIIISIIRTKARIKADFSDVEYCLTNIGYFMPGIGEASGENAAQRAVIMALSAKIYQNCELRPTGTALMQVTFGPNYSEEDIDIAFDTLRAAAGGSRDFYIIPAENPVKDYTSFKVEFIAPIQVRKQPAQPWKEEDALIKKPAPIAPIPHKVPATEDNKEQLFSNTEPALHTPYMPVDGIQIKKNDDILEPIREIKSKLTDITGRPRGNDELKKLDESAVKRYGGPTYTEEDSSKLTDADELLYLIQLLEKTSDETKKENIRRKIVEKKIQKTEE